MCLLSLMTSGWVLNWTGQGSMHCFCWTPLSLTTDQPSGGEWVHMHGPCGFSFERDQEPSWAGLTASCAAAGPASVQF